MDYQIMIDRELIAKIKDKKTKIGIVGMGYVGVPLGIEFAESGLKVVGFDTDAEKINNINSGKQISYAWTDGINLTRNYPRFCSVFS